MIDSVESIYELDGDDVGGYQMGWLLYGDVTPEDLDLFLNEGEGFEEAESMGTSDFDAEETWVRKVPLRGGGMRFVYATSPGPGARKCLRVEPARAPIGWCVNHVYEPATTGIPVGQVLDPPWPKVLAYITPPERRREHARHPQDGEAYVHLCWDCARKFHARRDEARARALSEMRAS